MEFRTLKINNINVLIYENGNILDQNNILLKKHITKNGYQQITIGKGKSRKMYLVHRLVAQAFIPNNENKPCVNHKDGNKQNNCVDNLEWCTYSENELHSHRILGKKLSKNNLQRMIEEHTKKYSKKVKKEDFKGNVIAIYNSLAEASKLNKVSEGNISMCCNKKRNSAGGYLWNFVL